MLTEETLRSMVRGLYRSYVVDGLRRSPNDPLGALETARHQLAEWRARLNMNEVGRELYAAATELLDEVRA